MSTEIEKMPIPVSQSPNLHLQIAFFVQATAQNPKRLHLLLLTTKTVIFKKLRPETFCFKNDRQNELIDDENSWWLIYFLI